MVKYINKISLFIIIFILIFNFTSMIFINGHDSFLNVEYDNCVADNSKDGDDEVWYYFNSYTNKDTNITEYRHLKQTVSEVSYWIANESYGDDGYTWESDNVSLKLASEIKTAFINSMLKWNNVKYYSYDDNWNKTEQTIIKIIPSLS